MPSESNLWPVRVVIIGMKFTWPVIQGTVIVLAGVLLGACGGTATTAATAGHRAAAGPRDLTAHGVFGRKLAWPEVAVTASGLYVAWQVSPFGRAPVSSELARVDPVTGAIEARLRLPGGFVQAINAGGALWVTSTGHNLLRLTPDTLTITGRRRVRGGGTSAPRLAVAGGWLWAVAGDQLLRLSLPAGRITRRIIMPGAASSNLSASTAGTALVVSEADNSGRGKVQRRDPVTGAIQAQFPVTGVSAPVAAGPAGSSIWISEATGMMGYVQRLDATTLRPAASCAEGRSSNGCVEGTNAIGARLAGGLVWVTQPGGGPGRNYCANPADGQILAHVDLPQAADAILAIGTSRIFYAAPGPGAQEYVRTLPIPVACRS